MKKLLIFLSFFLFIFVSCNKDNDSVNDDPTCNETVPTDELCQAFFERWFYNSSTTTCEKIGYSGCGEYGFANKEDCESCECDD